MKNLNCKPKSFAVTLMLALLAVSTLISQPSTAFAQGTAFTYQGRLNTGGAPANGVYDYRFRLDADPLGSTILATVTTNAIGVTNGLFATTIDFGAGWFAGSNYWLEVDVRTNGAGGYTGLLPLQSLTPTPYAIFATTASNVSGTVYAAQISGMVANGNLPSSPTVTGTVSAGSFSGNGANVTNVNAAALNGLTSASFWQTNGNAGANPTNGAFLGTTDLQPLELHVDGVRALRLEPGLIGQGAPNVIGGSPANFVAAGIYGATIGGGGTTSTLTNSVTGYFGTVSGGYGNTASGLFDATVGGGTDNTASYNGATVGGGEENTASGWRATVAGGYRNTASGDGATVGGGGFDGDGLLYAPNTASGEASTVSGGLNNVANNYAATVGGGYRDQATGWSATIGGGQGNVASNNYATIPGGYENVAGGQYSFAAGQQAQATNNGTFVWADSQNTSFASTSANQFLIRAQGGVGIGTNAPAGALDVASASGAPQIQVEQQNPDYARIRLHALTNAFWDIAAQSVLNIYSVAYGNVMTLQNNGMVGISVGTPGHYLDVGGRIRLRQEPGGATAGLWLYQNDVSSDRSFIGLDGDGYVGLWGNVGQAWGMVMNVTNNYVGIGNLTPSTYLQVVNATCNGSSWVNASDRNLKQNFAPVNPAEVLAKVAALPVQSWDYKAQPGDKHIGPVAQDFHAVFGLNGDDDKHIATVDESGVALAAIQGLNEKLNEKDAKINELEKRLNQLEQALQSLTQNK